jgi:hypothetical protein
MSTKPRKRHVQENVSTVVVPSEQWSGFLDDFSRQHRAWSTRLETYDLDTRENGYSQYRGDVVCHAKPPSPPTARVVPNPRRESFGSIRANEWAQCEEV